MDNLTGSMKDVAFATSPREFDLSYSTTLEEIMENRRAVRTDSGSRAPRPVESAEDHAIAVAAPILAEGDVLGCVLFVAAHGDGPAGETERKLAQAVSGFLGKQMES